MDYTVRLKLIEDPTYIGALDDALIVTDTTPCTVVFKEHVVREYNALAADNAALRAELEHLQAAYADNEAYGYELIQQRNEARAELATLQAAQQWRPVTEKPAVTAQYQVALSYAKLIADHMAYYTDTGWAGSGVIYWRPIPPLPPAPNEADEVQP